MNRWKFNRLVLLLFILILSFATACGNSAPAANNSGGNASESNSQQSASANAGKDSGGKEPVKIGAILSFSGTFAPLSESIKTGMEMYFQERNNEIAGRPIKIKYEDDEANPQVALRKYRQLVDSEKVDLLVGPISSAVVYALRDPIDKDKKLLIDANAAANDISWDKKSDYIYRTSISNWQDGHAAGEYYAQHIGKTAVTIGPDYPAGHETIEAFVDGFEKNGGKIVKQLFPKLGESDFATYITQISQTKPELVFAFLPGTDGIRFIQQYQQFGLKGKIPLTSSAEFGDPLITEPAGDAAEGIISVVHYNAAVQNEKNKAFVENFKKKYNRTPNYYDVYGYDSAKVIYEAITKTNSVKSDDLIKVIKGISFDSPRGKLQMDPKTNNLIQNMYVVKNVKKDGKIVQEVIETIKDVALPESPAKK